MNYLDQLESESVYILREAFSRIDKLAMLWSLGKDSNTMVWLAKKAFFGHVPFPVLHVDTGRKFPEMYAFRERYAKEWNLNLIVRPCPPVEEVDQTLPPAARSAARKTLGLRNVLQEFGFQGVIAGIRRDEESIRAKERVFSPRGEDGAWNLKDQPPEFWNQFKTEFAPGTHLRIHPLLDWTELNIWEYIRRENIPTVSLYYNHGDGKRYRSLGCYPCTHAVDSVSRNVDDIILELQSGKFANIAERSGRAQDKADGGGLETLRRDGYM